MRIFSLLLSVLLILSAPAAAQSVAPGFEKVHAKLKKKEADAVKDIARAEADATAAQALRVQAEAQIADNARAIETQRSAYLALASTFGGAATGKDAADESRALADIAKTWSAADENKAKGEKMIRQSEENAQKAIRDRTKAESKLAEIRDSLQRTIDVSAPAATAEPLAPEMLESVESSVLPPAQPGSLDDALLGASDAAPLKAD